MNIYALEGFNVTVAQDPGNGSVRGGDESDKELVGKYLEVGREYTVERTEVHGWHTEVFLREVPGVAFNSTNFEDVHEQDEANDQKHADWARFN